MFGAIGHGELAEAQRSRSRRYSARPSASSQHRKLMDRQLSVDSLFGSSIASASLAASFFRTSFVLNLLTKKKRKEGIRLLPFFAREKVGNVSLAK